MHKKHHKEEMEPHESPAKKDHHKMALKAKVASHEHHKDKKHHKSK